MATVKVPDAKSIESGSVNVAGVAWSITWAREFSVNSSTSPPTLLMIGGSFAGVTLIVAVLVELSIPPFAIPSPSFSENVTSRCTREGRSDVFVYPTAFSKAETAAVVDALLKLTTNGTPTLPPVTLPITVPKWLTSVPLVEIVAVVRTESTSSDMTFPSKIATVKEPPPKSKESI
jgi:hypothetical protein